MNKLPLPIPKKGNYMQNIGAKLKEGFERGAKICVNGALSTASLLAATMVNPVFGIAFFPTAFNFVRAIQLRTRKDSVFAITKKGNEVYIKQNINLGLANKIRELNKGKSSLEQIRNTNAVLLLQILVSLSQYQREFECDSQMPSMLGIEGKEGMRAYPKVLTTSTHLSIINMMKAIEEMGYISIVKNEEKTKTRVPVFTELCKRYFLAKTNNPEDVDRYFGQTRWSLFVEKAGLGQVDIKEYKKYLKYLVSGDVKGLESLTQPVREIQFRLTDKQINIEEISQRVNETPNEFSKSTITRLRGVFDHKTGILGQGNVNVRRTKSGYYIIEYTKSEGDRTCETQIKTSMQNELRQGVPTLEEQRNYMLKWGTGKYKEREPEGNGRRNGE